MNTKEIALALGLEGNFPEIEIPHYTFDSRLVEPRSLFFAVKGAKVDGHDFLKEVAEKGAVGAVVESNYTGPDFGLILFRVQNVPEALQFLAKTKLRLKGRPTIIAITGSVGKTSTKEFLYTLLNGSYTVAKSPGNANSQLSLPVVVLNHSHQGEVLLLEMGMNNKGHIAKLVSIAPPDYAVVTKIGHAHIGFFEDGVEGIAREKADIFSSYQTKVAFYNAADKSFQALSETGIAKKKTFSAQGLSADLQLVETNKGYKFLYQGEESREFEIPFQGKHLIENLAAAIVIAKELGIEDFKIAERISQLRNFERRFEIINREGITFINDSYSAIFDAVQAAIENFPNCSGRKVAVLGEMRELGSFAPTAYQLVGQSAVNKMDCLFCLGKATSPLVELFQKEGKEVYHFEDLATLKEKLHLWVKPGDAVLIKGAKPLEMWKILD